MDIMITFSQRQAGSAAGQFVIPPEFDDPLPDEILAAFEGHQSDELLVDFELIYAKYEETFIELKRLGD